MERGIHPYLLDLGGNAKRCRVPSVDSWPCKASPITILGTLTERPIPIEMLWTVMISDIV